MLSYMRKNAGSWMIKVLLFGVALSFVVGFGILPTLRNGKGGGAVVAQIGDRRITRADWDRAYENLLSVYRRVYKDQFSDEMAKQLRVRETALDNLINTVLQIEEAQRLGLQVSNEELRDRIRSLPYFRRNGGFDKDLYIRVLQLNHLTPAEFEKQQRNEMLVEAFQNFVQGTVKVSDQELWDNYVLENEQVRLQAFVVSPPALQGAVKVDEGALKDYYSRHVEEFLTPERVKVAYASFTPEAVRNQVEVYTGDIEEYYDSHIEEFSTPEEVHLRHILLRVPPNADPSVWKEKRKTMEGLLGRVRAGEDFAELAKMYSEDPGSKKEGGDLGYVKRGDLVPEVERAAFALKPGEVSDVVTSQYGLHLIKVEDYRASKVEPLKSVKEKIRETLIQEKAWRLARRKAEEYLWDVKERGGFPEAGSRQGDVLVKETDYFSRNEAIPGLGRDTSFAQAALSLDPGVISEVIRGQKGYYLLHVIEKKAPETPPFEEVRTQVEEQVRREESEALARKKAEEILETARSGKPLDALTEQQGIESIDTGFVSRLQKFVPKIGVSEEVLEAAFALTKQNPWPKQVYEVNGKYYVIHFKERREPDRKAFLAAKEELRTRQRSQKAQEVYREWLAELRERQGVKITGV